MPLAAAILKHAVKNCYVQAALGGLKPCVIGIVLATGVYMVIKNCFPSESDQPIDVRSIGITIFLAAVSVGYGHLTRKKLSPVMLILVSAAAGAVVYGIM